MEEVQLTTEREAGAFIQSQSMARGSEQGKTAAQAAAAGTIIQSEDIRFLSTLNSTHSGVECHGFHTSKHSSLTYYE